MTDTSLWNILSKQKVEVFNLKDALFTKNVRYVLVMLSIVIGAVLFYYVSGALLKWFLPFILAFILANITEPVVQFLQKKVKLPRPIASAITILFTLGLIISILTLVINRIIFEIKDLAKQLPGFFESFSVQIIAILDQGVSSYFDLPVDISKIIDTAISSLASNLTSIIMPITNATTRFAYSLPSILIFIVVLFISTYFISSDRDKILNFIKKQIPENWHVKIIGVKDDLLLALLGYIKAQLILMSITFVEITTGLFIIGVNYAILFGLIISLIDALPIVGVGSVLIPWALISLIFGNYYMAFSLLILYVIALLVRQMLEPRVLGAQIGLYPLVTLMGMYAGLKIFGIPGMIFGPITILVIKNLHKAEIIKIWKD